MGEHINKGLQKAENYEPELKPTFTWLDIELNGGKPNGNGYEGNISAAAIGLSPEQIEVYAKLVEDCYDDVTPGAPDRCGDGRATIMLPTDIDANSRISLLEDLKSQALGPQLFGGTFGEALPYRIASGNRTIDHSAYDDFIDLVHALREKGINFAPGTHSDEHASDSIIGCGKKDKHSLILDKISDVAVRPHLKEQAALMLVGNLMSETAFGETFKKVTQDIDKLNRPETKTIYLGTEKEQHKFKHKVFRAVAENDSSAAPQVMGSHREVFVVINYVNNQTFNNNLFVNKIDNKAQAFNVDFWRVAERANALFADDVGAKDRYLVTAAVDTIATAMVLTAGDQRLGVRS